MATKTASKSSSRKTGTTGAKRARKTAARPAASEAAGAARSARAFAGMPPLPSPEQFAKLREMMTPEQAFELYRQNARLALDIIDAAIESTAKMRKLQFEGEEEARAFQKSAARRAATAANPQDLAATGQSVGQEAVQKSLVYWSQMFDLVVEMQKRLFTIIDEQMADVPGVKQAKEALKMMPDLSQAEKLVSAMQGVLTSGGSAFESMQKVMGDFTRMAQHSMPGAKR